MNLRNLVEMAPDANILRDLIGLAALRLMELNVAALTGATPAEHSPEWLGRSNRYLSSASEVGVQ